ncbi:MAG: acyl-CoA dehydrogenase [Calditrichaeota bacterium]|nr:MAG: acyl-CoA dehydrogenase [Calditrichota bacterium]
MVRSPFFTEDHETFRQTVRQFMQREVEPQLSRWEAEGRLPREIWQRMGVEGFLGIPYPEQYGGSEADFFFSVVFLEELARPGLGGFSAAVSVHIYMASMYLYKFASQALKQRYLVPAIQGEKIGALAITEPNAGSDVAAIQTRAVREGDVYLINGAKTFITNGDSGDFIVLAAKTDPEAGAGGVSLFVVDRQAPGVSARSLKKLGWHCSDTAELSFQDVQVPAEQRIGEENQGFFYIMDCFQLERLVAAVLAVAGSERCLELTLNYLHNRQAFGRPLARFQALRHRLADLATELEAARQLTYHTCWLYQQGLPAVKECSMAKLHTTELAVRVADQCLQCFGGYGYMEEYPIARMFRDARAGTIVGGTSEIMREIIARILIDGVEFVPRTGRDGKSGEEPAETPPVEDQTATQKAATCPETAAQAIAGLPDRFRTDRAGDYQTVIHFVLSGEGGGDFTVSIEKGRCLVSPGLHGQPRCVVKTKASTYLDIELGRTSAQTAFLMGRVKVSNVGELMRFIKLFRPLKER